MTRKAAVAQVTLLGVAAGLFAVLCSLGVWQLGRATEKEAQFATASTRSGQPALDATTLLNAQSAAADLRFHRVVLRGHYDAEHQFLLDNRTRNGVAGYEVYTPLLVSAAPRPAVVLVNRGWLPTGPQRTRLPEVAVAAGPRRVEGVVELPRTRTFLLGEAGYEQRTWPRVVQRVEPDAVAAALGVNVADVAVRLDPAADDGFMRDWPPYTGIGPERHRAYAFQWFALATTLLVIVVILLRRRHRDHGTEDT